MLKRAEDIIEATSPNEQSRGLAVGMQRPSHCAWAALARLQPVSVVSMKFHPTQIRTCCYPNWLHLPLWHWCWIYWMDVLTYWALKTNFRSKLLDASTFSDDVEAVLWHKLPLSSLPAGTSANDGGYVCVRYVRVLLLPGTCLAEELRCLRIEHTSVRLTWSQTLLLSPFRVHTHTRTRATQLGCD